LEPKVDVKRNEEGYTRNRKASMITEGVEAVWKKKGRPRNRVLKEALAWPHLQIVFGGKRNH